MGDRQTFRFESWTPAQYVPTIKGVEAMALYGKATLDKIQQGVDSLTPFNAGNIRGLVGAHEDFYPTGRMPGPYATDYRADAQRGAITYTIMSYATPIAWRLADGTWVQPPAKYSVTTTGHQSRVAVAIANHGFYRAGNR